MHLLASTSRRAAVVLAAALALTPAAAAAAPPVAPLVSADPAGPARGTIVMVHGGGWVGHDARAQQHLMDAPGALFRRRGWRVVSIDYAEGAAGLQNILDAAGGEIARGTGDGPLCLYGESAGGHLALVASARLRAIDCVIGVGTPTDLVNYQAEALPDSEPRVKLVALRAARYFGTTPAELAPWDPVTLAPQIGADLLLLREGDDAVVSPAHARRVQAAIPATQILELPPGDPSDLSTALLHGTVSGAGRAAYAAALGAFADRAVAARRAERLAARTGCRRVARSVREIGAAGVRAALRCLAQRSRSRRRSPMPGWRQSRVTIRGEVNAARIWARLRTTSSGRRALRATAARHAAIVFRSGERSRVTLRAR